MDIGPFGQPGRFWRGNLHTHSTLSDGALKPEQVIHAYQRAGYDFIELSDHFVSIFNWPIADTLRFRSNSFTTLIGAELHAPSTAVGELWHILAVGLPLDFAPAGKDESGPELAARAKAAGAFVGIAHPAWSQLTIEDGRALASAHAVEIYNHGCAVENDRGDGWYLMDQLLNEGRRLNAFATDDAHFQHGDFDAFGGFVEVKAQSLDPDLLLEALKAGHFYSSQGPRIHALSGTRKELTISCSPVDCITLLGGTSRTLTRVGKHIEGATLELARINLTFLPGGLTPWFRVVVIDAAGRKAWTNPIWVQDLPE